MDDVKVVLDTACEDGNIQSPVTVEKFPEHCRNMHKNSDRPFAEEFQV